MKLIIVFLGFLTASCQTGNLTLVSDLPSSLKETSAIQILPNSDLYWVIEDSGNDPVLYGLDERGRITKTIEITNAFNIDWEDLARDPQGAIYIGDFGNNNKNRNDYAILKISDPVQSANSTEAEIIAFRLPKGEKPKDFEAMFWFRNALYVFSKQPKRGKLFKVPDTAGEYEAELVTEFNLKGKQNAVTAADLYNGKIALLNHEKVWILSDFEGEDFFGGQVQALEFEHDTQKEGLSFMNDSTLVITDEYSKKGGGNIYTFNPDTP